ncbi:tRNA epoxyqueuosine(34) reductase QueG [Enhydrobacter sp.]|jgi:epoxyqueuosine reductase|uniref:tRNA epoxyqueuosine(34) reductase QueG n=1 Tax=Enhydrobacter sp. TaxID=1894999 RepID=UPI00261375DA|nr:tRNA epoxyqueuosine(34) reductase QueG [Enhydrobacter sp.]WIM11648.1 MAG: Epoxyqueuosine reductase QueG [Enhydrobacter sp.]
MSRRPPVPKRPPRPATAIELRDAIRNEALRLGFDAVGFAPASLAPEIRRERLAHLASFVEQGFHGDMGWLAERSEQRVDPATLWPEARTVVSLALNYAPGRDPRAALAAPERGAISVYAQGRDYHDVVKSKLKALGRFIWDTYRHQIKVFVDTAPVMEKPAAQASGLGWQGKHTNLVSRRFGSWLFLGELLLSAELPVDAPEADHCGQCHACLDVCPTGAFPAPYRLEARRCISYLTIEHEGPIDLDLRPLLGNRIYGCDDCLAVCPWNKFARTAHENSLWQRPDLDAPSLAELAALDDAAFRKHFAGTAIKRIGRDRFLRNVAYALGNSDAAETALIAVDRLLADPSPLVRGAAVWALSRLAPDEFRRRRATIEEVDDSVRREWAMPIAAP